MPTPGCRVPIRSYSCSTLSNEIAGTGPLAALLCDPHVTDVLVNGPDDVWFDRGDGLERATGKTFFWAGRYSENLNERVTLTTELNVFAAFKPKLPEKYRNSKFVFLANIAPDLQRDVLHQVKVRPKLAALDTMNYWIERTNAELRETLKHVDILMINDSETRELSNEHNLLRAAKHIFKMGPTTLVVKRGEYGAMMVDKHGLFCVPAFPLEEPHDPTGAGDSFAGDLYRARDHLELLLRWTVRHRHCSDEHALHGRDRHFARCLRPDYG